MSYLTHLDCSYCSNKFEANKLWNLCPFCNKPLLARYDLDSIKQSFSRKDIIKDEPNLWRYEDLLPVQDSRYILSLGEGFTPLIRANNLGSAIGFDNLFIKDESINPTTSFKARGLSVAVSRAFELGVKEISVPSAGNAAGAMTAYAALAELKAYVFMPKDVPTAFISECRALGAEITLIDGLITDCGKAAADGVKKFHRFDMSTLKEPYRIEGKKTMGYELAEQMNWDLPDVIIYPTGGGTGLIGMWKAFEEMEQLGWINSSKPRMVTVQAEGCAPIVKAFEGKNEFAEPWHDAKTIADGLRVPSAVGDFLILRVLRESNGTAVPVSDDDMLNGSNMIGKTQGLFTSPETGATLAAFKKLKDQHWINDGDNVVLFNTGSGHKYSHLWESD